MYLETHAHASSTNWTLSTLDFERLLPLVSAAQSPAARGALDELDQKLANATLVAPDQIDANVVTMNSRVLLHCASWEEPREYRLVYTRHDACKPGEVSVVSPLGAGLLARRVGTRFALGSHPSSRSFQVVALPYQPESAGDWDL
ncbi:MAG: GreA/GreB family elongation factor [Myxococcota bacterium]|nr:GreA/GreB family elongation factor [Myxococcota bacterium]